MARSLTTYKDLTDRLTDYLGANATREAARDVRGAVLDAYRELASAHRWAYYQGRGRVRTVAPQSAGTVGYTHTGGTSERLLTLTGAAWPSWAARGAVLIDSVVYQVAGRKSDTEVTLEVDSNPGADLAAGTAYTLYQVTYLLPSDLLQVEEVYDARGSFRLEYGEPGAWLGRQSGGGSQGPASPRLYCVEGHGDYYGCLALALWPPPDDVYHLDFIYQRRPRPLRVEAHADGTVTGTAGSATLSGVGTAWTAALAGAVLRVSSTKQDLPTGPAGANPAAEERVVLSVESATGLTLDAALAGSYAGVRHLVSDPVDVEEGAMLTALYRCCEAQTAIARIMKNLPQAQQLYRDALVRAREADSRSFARRGAGRGHAGYRRLADMPRGPDVP